MKTNIILIGTGNIGKRHLQAISNLSSVDRITCYDTAEDALASVPEFCKSNNLNINNLVFSSDYGVLLQSISDNTVVIIATTAKGRGKLLEDVIRKAPLAIIAEKPLCQTLEEYEAIMKLSKTWNVPVYINFARHMFSFYRDIHTTMKDAQHKSLNAVFPDGMGCIGIHMFELMTWLLSPKTYKIIHSSVEGVFKTKRKGYSDIYGSLVILLDDTHLCSFTTSNKEKVFSIEISSGRKEYKIYEASQKMIISDILNNVNIHEVEILYVSQMTDKIVSDILEKRKTNKLPDVFQSYLAHKILFDYMALNRKEKTNIT
ncbi:MAG: hypothetical protein FD145_54 [Candidatus Saganbacteria bacterium]|uniref:Gfo/Idh/MocA-like oxidoreductase N-terminal domain-containing protein n=1 Tax=Candidatus Saganbacteria bacterium TaxID=2575572 RepID=A0A833L2F4_UNCSA|nr:MAG: hypothetical protein FD145_54 [Candidatus Saganbacteria bacterium]